MQSTLKIEALEMDDTKDIFVTRIRLKSAGEAYAYQMNFAKNEVIQHECPLKTSGELQIGPLINKGKFHHLGFVHVSRTKSFFPAMQ